MPLARLSRPLSASASAQSAKWARSVRVSRLNSRQASATVAMWTPPLSPFYCTCHILGRCDFHLEDLERRQNRQWK